MHLVALAWIYVVLMMALVEAFTPNGTVLGAVFTFFLYGVLPLGIVLYIMATPARRKAQRARSGMGPGSAAGDDRRHHAAGDAVAPKREEP